MDACVLANARSDGPRRRGSGHDAADGRVISGGASRRAAAQRRVELRLASRRRQGCLPSSEGTWLSRRPIVRAGGGHQVTSRSKRPSSSRARRRFPPSRTCARSERSSSAEVSCLRRVRLLRPFCRTSRAAPKRLVPRQARGSLGRDDRTDRCLVRSPRAWSRSRCRRPPSPLPIDSPYVVMYGSEQAPAALTTRLGKGRAIWWAGSAPLANGGIGRPSHVEFFVNTLGPAGTRTVLWDEFYHGHTRSFWSYLADTPFFFAILQLAAIVGVALFTYARRRRPIRERVLEPRTSPLEFIDTMGGLYERARASGAAVATVHAHVRRRLLAALGLPIGVRRRAARRCCGGASGVRWRGAFCGIVERAGGRERSEPHRGQGRADCG